MSKKSIEREAAQQAVVSLRLQGKTDQEIYNELAESYYDKKGLALLITATVTPELKEKYSALNKVLLALLALSVIFKLLAVFTISMDLGEPWFLIMLLFAPLINLYFIYEIARYNAPVYRFCGLLIIVGAMQSIGKTKELDATSIIITIAFAAAIAGLSFYLDNNMFPNYRPNNLQKDSNGEYVLD